MNPEYESLEPVSSDITYNEYMCHKLSIQLMELNNFKKNICNVTNKLFNDVPQLFKKTKSLSKVAEKHFFRFSVSSKRCCKRTPILFQNADIQKRNDSSNYRNYTSKISKVRRSVQNPSTRYHTSCQSKFTNKRFSIPKTSPSQSSTKYYSSWVSGKNGTIYRTLFNSPYKHTNHLFIKNLKYNMKISKHSKLLQKTNQTYVPYN